MLKLRDSVEVRAEEGELQLIDHLTGLRLTVGPELDPRSSADPELWDELRAVGLSDEGLSAEEIRHRQRALLDTAAAHRRLRALRASLEFACEKVPYYRARRELYDPSRLQSPTDLSRLPLLTKADLRAAYPDQIVADGVDLSGRMDSGLVVVATSSGSTGERVQVLADLQLNALPRNFPAIWGLAPLDGVPKMAVFASPTCMGRTCHLGAMTFEERLRHQHTLFLNSTADLFSLRRSLVQEVEADLTRFQPHLLMANPVYLHLLLRRADALGITLPPVRAVLSSYQFLTGASRRFLEQRLGVPVIDFYAASDLGGSRAAVGCHRGRVHVREDHVQLEVLDPSGLPVKGQLGRVAVTTTASRLVPLVRYLVGDVGVLLEADCDCPLREWACFELHGREKDLLRLDGRWVSTRNIDDVISSFPWVDFYRCEQPTDATLDLRVVGVPEVEPDPEGLSHALATRFALQRVQVKVVRRLEPETSLKFRQTACLHRTPGEAA